MPSSFASWGESHIHRDVPLRPRDGLHVHSAEARGVHSGASHGEVHGEVLGASRGAFRGEAPGDDTRGVDNGEVPRDGAQVDDGALPSDPQ